MDRHLFRRFAAVVCILIPLVSIQASGTDGDNRTSPMPVAEVHGRLPATAPSGGSGSITMALESLQALRGPEVFFETWQDRPEVQRYISYFTGSVGRNWILDGIERSAPFKDFILDTIASKKLPRELYFIVLVESTFNVDAVSRSGAAGLWQFMLNSLGNMKTSEWIDERFDFWTSTQAAMDKLAYNYSVLNDWLLAFAAYNAGLGRIQRLIAKYPGKDFWDLSTQADFPPETKQYVPRILAAAYIGSHPARYGFPTDWNPALRWEKIAVTSNVHIPELEKKAGLPRGLLVRGNAELRFETTPLGADLYYIKSPSNFRGAILTALGPAALASGLRVHKVTAGETLYGLARKYGINEERLLSVNKLTGPTLSIGQTLMIPLPTPTALTDNNKQEHR